MSNKAKEMDCEHRLKCKSVRENDKQNKENGKWREWGDSVRAHEREQESAWKRERERGRARACIFTSVSVLVTLRKCCDHCADPPNSTYSLRCRAMRYFTQMSNCLGIRLLLPRSEVTEPPPTHPGLLKVGPGGRSLPLLTYWSVRQTSRKQILNSFIQIFILRSSTQELTKFCITKAQYGCPAPFWMQIWGIGWIATA